MNRNSVAAQDVQRAPTLKPLAAAMLAALYPALPSMAQEADETAEGPDVEQIVVTGSRIKHDAFTSAAPMEVVLTETAAVRGISDVASMLQTTTVAAGSPQVTPAISALQVVNGGLGNYILGAFTLIAVFGPRRPPEPSKPIAQPAVLLPAGAEIGAASRLPG